MDTSNNTINNDNGDTKLQEVKKDTLTNKTSEPDDKLNNKLQEVKINTLTDETSEPVGERKKLTMMLEILIISNFRMNMSIII